MNFGKAPDYLKAAALEPFDLMEEPTPDGVPAGGFFLPFNPATVVPEPSTVKEPALDASDDLEELLQIATKELKEVLLLPLDREEKEFATVLRVKMTGIQTVFNTQVRVDEQRLRRKQSDSLPKLLEALDRFERTRRASNARLVNP